MPAIPPPMTMTSMIRSRPKAQDQTGSRAGARMCEAPGIRRDSRERSEPAFNDDYAGRGKRAMIAPNARRRDGERPARASSQRRPVAENPGVARLLKRTPGPSQKHYRRSEERRVGEECR